MAVCRYGASAAAQWLVDALFHQKFIALFSMLFGASLFLVGGEREDAARGRLLRRRLFWLAVIALIHGLAIWWGTCCCSTPGQDRS